MSKYPKDGYVDAGQEVIVARHAVQGVITLPELRVAWYSVAPDAKDTDGILLSVTLTGAAVDLVPDGQPDVARQLIVTGDADSEGAVITVGGYDILGNSLSEGVTIPGTGAGFAAATSAAFAVVETISVPAGSGTVKVGLGQGIGLPAEADLPSVLAVYWNGGIVAPGTWTQSVDAISGSVSQNIIDPGDTVGTAYDGVKMLDVYFGVAAKRGV